MVLSFIIIIAGFACLLLGADWLVKGASSLAKRFNVPEIVIGLTIVAFGTSTPELCVNLISNLQGATDICFGDPIGSNILNILLILGITALICPLDVKRNTTLKEIPFSFLAAIIFMLLANDAWYTGQLVNSLSRIDSLILLFFFGLFLLYTKGLTKHGAAEISDVKMYPILLTIVAIIAGLAGLVLGGKIVVSQAVKIAQSIGISQKIIALTIIAAGTSLPELATSVTAALKKHPDIAMGNIVGSNIFNILFILGISSMIRPLPYKTTFNLDLIVLFITTFLLFIFMFIDRRHKLDRWQGGLFVIIYLIYTVFYLK